MLIKPPAKTQAHMHTEPKKSFPLFRKFPLGLSPWLIVGMAVILGLAIAALSVKNAQRERGYMTQNMTDRAEALIWALEAASLEKRRRDAERERSRWWKKPPNSPALCSWRLPTTTASYWRTAIRRK